MLLDEACAMLQTKADWTVVLLVLSVQALIKPSLVKANAKFLNLHALLSSAEHQVGHSWRLTVRLTRGLHTLGMVCMTTDDVLTGGRTAPQYTVTT